MKPVNSHSGHWAASARTVKTGRSIKSAPTVARSAEQASASRKRCGPGMKPTAVAIGTMATAAVASQTARKRIPRAGAGARQKSSSAVSRRAAPVCAAMNAPRKSSV